MQSTTGSASKVMFWAGTVITGLVILFMLFDASVKLLKTQTAVDGTAQLGYPASMIVPLGIVLLACVVLYAIPRTSVLGAVLLTGYLGGATATQVRVSSPWFFFPVVFGILVWAGLFCRDSRLRSLIPIRKD